ncbi:MAG TPA: hypothetical protein DGT21_05465 [Armatimonadetes bacterium]|nr:hypothetical protein [Armatimonadota bacterium]
MRTVDSSYFDPRGLRELLSSALRETVSRSAAGLVTVAVFMLPVALLQIVGAYITAELGVAELQEQIQSGQMTPEQLDFRPFMLLGAFELVAMVIMFVAAYFAVAGVARLLAARAIGKDIGAMGAWDACLRLLSRLLSGSIVQMLVYGAALIVIMVPVVAIAAVLAAAMGQQEAGSGGTLIQVVAGAAAAIPLVILSTYLCPMPSVSAIEDRGPFATVGRSFGLISGSFGRTFLALLIGIACLAVPLGVLSKEMGGSVLASLQSSLGDAPGGAVAAVPGALVFLLVIPFIYSLYVLVYFDVRSRKDGPERFTPAALAHDLGEALPEPDAPASQPATEQPDGPA